MKIANIIIAHKNPDQLLRLVNQYSGDHFHNYIHLDARADISGYSAVVNHPKVTMMPRVRVTWAGNSFFYVIVDSLRAAFNSKQNYSYYNLISGMDFPIRPVDEFHDFLEDSYKKGPVEFFEILDLSVWPGAHRFERIHFNEWTMKGRYFTERIVNWFVPRRKYWGGRMVPYGQGTWFTASDKFIAYAFKFFEDNPGYLRFLETTWSPDEFCFNSLVMNSPFKENVQSKVMRCIDFSENKVNPKTFTAEDADVLLSSGKFIARKFDASIDSTILDELEVALKSKILNLKS